MAAATCMISPVIFGCVFGRLRLDPEVTAQHSGKVTAVLPPCPGAGKALKVPVTRPIGVGLG
jgi:hypothetical protein